MVPILRARFRRAQTAGLVLLLLIWAGPPGTLRAAGAEPAGPDFSRYPASEAFRYFVERQTNAAFHRQQTNFLAVTAFPEGDRYGLQYFVTEQGREWDQRNVFAWAIQNRHAKEITGPNWVRLRSAVADLPATNATPPLDRLVIVSFRRDTNWVTRTYDCGDLPAAMRRVYDVIGERSETKSRRDPVPK